jgi:hypothetical protein
VFDLTYTFISEKCEIRKNQINNNSGVLFITKTINEFGNLSKEFNSRQTFRLIIISTFPVKFNYSFQSCNQVYGIHIT